jgi:hypothetical protein
MDSRSTSSIRIIRRIECSSVSRFDGSLEREKMRMPNPPHRVTIEIEPSNSKDAGPCKCCGKSTRTVWGFVWADGDPRACYFVQWTLGRLDHGARFDVVVGSWEEASTEADRDAVSLAYHLADTGPSFALSDVAGRPAAELGKPHGTASVAAPLADEVFSIAQAVLESDRRVSELLGRKSE